MAERLRPYRIQVWCTHATTRGLWPRQCPQGCHADGRPLARHPGYEAGERCQRVYPSEALLREAGIAAHERQTGCACVAVFWMRHGDEHHAYQEAEGSEWVSIQAEERVLPGADLRSLADSMDWGRR